MIRLGRTIPTAKQMRILQSLVLQRHLMASQQLRASPPLVNLNPQLSKLTSMQQSLSRSPEDTCRPLVLLKLFNLFPFNTVTMLSLDESDLSPNFRTFFRFLGGYLALKGPDLIGLMQSDPKGPRTGFCTRIDGLSRASPPSSLFWADVDGSSAIYRAQEGFKGILRSLSGRVSGKVVKGRM